MGSDRVSACCEVLRDWVMAHGLWLSPDGRVSEATAAAILNRSERTLESWRYGSARIRYHRPSPRSAVTYNLRDLAEYIEAGYIEE
jgi:hypothetical protein